MLKHTDIIAEIRSKQIAIFTPLEAQQRFLNGDIMYAKNSKVKPKYAKANLNSIDNSNLEQSKSKTNTSRIRTANATRGNSNVIDIRTETLRKK